MKTPYQLEQVAKAIVHAIVRETSTDVTVMHQCGAWFIRFEGEPESAGRYVGRDTVATSRLVAQAVDICHYSVIPAKEIEPEDAVELQLMQWGICD